MELNRHGEQDFTPFRSGRLYVVNGQSYFDTREGKQFGPYRTKNEADKALAVFVAQRLCESISSWPDNNSLSLGSQNGTDQMAGELLVFFCQKKHYGQVAALAWANKRRKELMEHRGATSNSNKRIEALEYVLDQEE